MADTQDKKDSLVFAAFRAMRPVHWVKNLSLFAAIFLTGFLFDKTQFSKVVWAFVVFNLAASATYIVNDILDIASDRLHPTKKFRAIASGSLPVPLAVLEAIFLAISAVFVSILSPLNSLFLLLVVGYMALQLFYSFGLKNIEVLDILIIAAGFTLRVYAGAVAIDGHLSVWFLLCVISVALFLAAGKRRAELNLVDESKILTRKTLGTYKKDLLNSYVTMFGNASWMSWALFTFFESPKATVPFWLVLAELSRATTVNKLLMLTIPVVIFGIMRYEFLIFSGKSEAPEKLFLTDIPLIGAVATWLGIVYWVLYSGVAVSGGI